jgi:hypothetical protein
MSRTPFLARDFEVPTGSVHTRDYLTRIGVPDISPATCPFDPGYDPLTFEGHLAQSSHLMETMKISMACWQVSNEEVSRWKVAACRHYGACLRGDWAAAPDELRPSGDARGRRAPREDSVD